MAEVDFLGLVRNCMCTNIRKLSRIITRIYDARLQPSGININQLGIMLTIQGLADVQTNPPTIGDVAKSLVMEKSTLSRNLRHLEDAGLIELTMIESNRTQKSLKITEKGINVILDAYGYWDEVQNDIRENLGEIKFNNLIDLLNDLEFILSDKFLEDNA